MSGLLGLPNVSKSALMSQVSAANPWLIIPLRPLAQSWGRAHILADASFVMADIPGLIVGAAEEPELGRSFDAILLLVCCCIW